MPSIIWMLVPTLTASRLDAGDGFQRKQLGKSFWRWKRGQKDHQIDGSMTRVRILSNSVWAEGVAVVAYFAPVIGVVLQLISFLRHGEKGQKENER